MTSPFPVPVRSLLCSLLVMIGLTMTSVQFTVVHRGSQSQIEAQREVVVRTATEWTALWREHAPDAPIPKIDFSRFMVVGVFLGTRPTGGYSVEIASIDNKGDELLVTYREQQPPRDAMLTQALTAPVVLVRVPQQKSTVRFTRVGGAAAPR